MSPNLRSFTEPPVTPQADGIIDTLNCCVFYIYNIILHVFFGIHFHYTLCKCAMCLTSLTDSFYDRIVSPSF